MKFTKYDTSGTLLESSSTGPWDLPTPTMKERTALLMAMRERGCDYFDYEPLTQTEWRLKLENSNTNKYVFISLDVAVFKNKTGVGIRHYLNHNVATWFITNE